MADVFVSYARADKALVAPLVAAIEAKGWSVWWDPEITPGQEFDDQIDAEIDAARAVLVVWTPTSVASRWVRGEAREAAERGILVPVRFEQARLPMDVRAIHTTDLDSWNEDSASPHAQEFLRALSTMIARTQAAQSAKAASTSAPAAAGKDSPRFTIC
ncbi:MAG: toll/interleukin-1 receptor domain-containing protein, partial [Rudaea sp.]